MLQSESRILRFQPESSSPNYNAMLPYPNTITLGLLLSTFSHHHNQHIYPDNVNFFKSDPSVDAYGWSGDFRPLNGGGTVPRDNNRLVTAVLLGWLGDDPKHLKRYADIYASRGINTLGFVVPVSKMLWFDLGRNVESRIERPVSDIVAWLMESEKDGKERRLVFHTFSNTGWLVWVYQLYISNVSISLLTVALVILAS